MSAFPRPPAQSRLAQLLKLEGETRACPSARAIIFHAINEPRPLLSLDQAFFLRWGRNKRFAIEAVSDVAKPDVHMPLLRAIRRMAQKINDKHSCQPLDLGALLAPEQAAGNHALWLPLLDRERRLFGALLYVRSAPWDEDLARIAERLGSTYAHALRALTPPQLLHGLSVPRWALWAVPCLSAALAFIPVPLTSLAPFEVVARDPMPVTAPLDGVVAEVLVPPNAAVRAGQPVLRLETTALAAEEAIAAQRVVVAEARLATARNGAFADTQMKQSLSVLEQELALARAQHDLAKGQLDRALVLAPASGTAVYAAASDWRGRPVRTGEQVMQIADPARTSYRIELALQESIALAEQASVRLFFDADPLHPRNATATDMSFHAVKNQVGAMVYVVKANPPADEPPMRLGLRGTAQLTGRKVSLGFFLLRRPIAALRQRFGL